MTSDKLITNQFKNLLGITLNLKVANKLNIENLPFFTLLEESIHLFLQNK
jgi:hypothetical protein